MMKKAASTFADIAREEFANAAKVFFAPIYGSGIVISHLLRDAGDDETRPGATPPPAPKKTREAA